MAWRCNDPAPFASIISPEHFWSSIHSPMKPANLHTFEERLKVQHLTPPISMRYLQAFVARL